MAIPILLMITSSFTLDWIVLPLLLLLFLCQVIHPASGFSTASSSLHHTSNGNSQHPFHCRRQQQQQLSPTISISDQLLSCNSISSSSRRNRKRGNVHLADSLFNDIFENSHNDDDDENSDNNNNNNNNQGQTNKKTNKNSNNKENKDGDDNDDNNTTNNPTTTSTAAAVQPPKHYNDDAPPFSKLERPQDRARRMEMVRELQKSYYAPLPESSSSSPTSTSSSSKASSLSPLEQSFSTDSKSISMKNSSLSSSPSSSSISAKNSSCSNLTTKSSNNRNKKHQNQPLSYGSTFHNNLPILTSHDFITTNQPQQQQHNTDAATSALLPGYQYVWNIEKAEHCHMFHSILATNPPWYVGHLFLPSGDSLGNGNGVVGGNGVGRGGGNGYGDALGGPSNANENVPSFIDASQSYMQIQNHLNKINNNGISKNDSNNNANKNPTPPLMGTLLRITDRRLQDTDGKMILAVQAIDKFRVENIVSTSPYLVTNVEVWPEEEMVNEYFDRALLTSASSVSGSGTTSGDNAVVNDDTMDIAGDYDDNNSEDASLLSNNPLVVTGAARAAAVADSNRCRKFEYLPFFLEEKVRRPPSANTLQKSTASLEEEEKRKKKEDIGAEYSNVVQLSNYDALSFTSLEDSSSVTSQALKVYWTNLREMQESANDDTSSTADATTYYDDPLFHSNAMTSETSSPLPTPLAFTPSSSSPSTKSSLTPYYSIESIEMLEYHLWRTVDEMIRLLSKASSSAVPLPTQLLGLLPKRKDWPREFILEDYANSLSLAGGTIGTFAQSSFVRVDQVTSRNNNSTDTTATSSVASQSSSPSYSNLRRAQRMSYAIWLLLDGLAMTGAQPAPPSRDLILGMNSIGERLDAAKRTLDGINGILRKMIPENRN